MRYILCYEALSLKPTLTTIGYVVHLFFIPVDFSLTCRPNGRSVGHWRSREMSFLAEFYCNIVVGTANSTPVPSGYARFTP